MKEAKSLPKLGRGLNLNKGLIEFEVSPSSTKKDLSKENFCLKYIVLKIKNILFIKLMAACILKSKGGLASSSSSSPQRSREKRSSEQFKQNVRKRLQQEVDEEEEATSSPKTKKQKIESEVLFQRKSLLGNVDINKEMFQDMIEKKSKHSHLVKEHQDEQVEKYYNQLEKKEMLENKMASTMEVETKAVICLTVRKAKTFVIILIHFFCIFSVNIRHFPRRIIAKEKAINLKSWKQRSDSSNVEIVKDA